MTDTLDDTLSLTWSEKMALHAHFKGSGGCIFDASSDTGEQITVETEADTSPQQIPIELHRGKHRPRHIWGLPGYLTDTSDTRHYGIVGYDPIGIRFVILITDEGRERVWCTKPLSICRKRDGVQL